MSCLAVKGFSLSTLISWVIDTIANSSIELKLKNLSIIIGENVEDAMSDLNYFLNLISLINKNSTDITFFAQKIAQKIKFGNSIWIMGNGGSASTAEHFETDLSFIKMGSKFPRIKAFSLTANSSVVTAIANDLGFDQVFSHQLRRKAYKGDLCFIISASGNSENLIKAIDEAKDLELETIALLGFDGGKALNMVNHAILMKTDIGQYGPVEDLHLALCHAISLKVLNLMETKND